MPKAHTPLAQRIQELIDFDKRLYFFLLLILFVLIRYLTNSLILDAVPNSEELEASGAFTFFYIFNTLDYLMTPFAMLWKFTVVAFLFWLGAFFLGYKVPFKSLWQFALVAEVVFLFPELIRFLVYINPENASTFLEIEQYRPLSLLALIGPDQTAQRFHYPLATLNLFELIYGVIWVLGFHSISRRSLKESSVVVFVSYFVPLAIFLTWFAMVYRD